MVTLMKRATKTQHKVWRIVKGAVRDTAHVHGIELPYHFCTSVAKRASGTLTAAMPDVLAAAVVSVRQNGAGDIQGPPHLAKAGSGDKPADRSQLVEGRSTKGRRLVDAGRRPLLHFLKEAPKMMRDLKHQDPVAYVYMQEALRNVGKTVGRLDATDAD